MEKYVKKTGPLSESQPLFVVLHHAGFFLRFRESECKSATGAKKEDAQSSTKWLGRWIDRTRSRICYADQLVTLVSVVSESETTWPTHGMLNNRTMLHEIKKCWEPSTIIGRARVNASVIRKRSFEKPSPTQ